MLDRTKNFLIGLFVLTAIALVIYIMAFLHPSLGDEGQTIKVRFADIDKVSVGTRVLFGGHPVGEVVKISVVPDARLQKPYINDDIYIYELTLKIDSRVTIYNSDRISSRTSGLLGEKSVSIDPEPPKPGLPLLKVTDQVLYAAPPVSIEDAVHKFEGIGETIHRTFLSVNEALESLSKENFWGHLAASSRQLDELLSSLNRPEEMKQIIEEIRAFSARLNPIAERFSDALAFAEPTLSNFYQISDSAKGLFQEVRAGKGTLGNLLVKEEFYLKISSLISKAQTLMDDINHWGLLFHNNPQWKRVRARRMNLLSRLQTPQEFHNYFNDEVNQISTSLSRVAMVLQDCESINYWEAVCLPGFESVFSDLLRRVEGLDEELKMINEQVAERRSKGYEQCRE